MKKPETNTYIVSINGGILYLTHAPNAVKAITDVVEATKGEIGADHISMVRATRIQLDDNVVSLDDFG